MPRTSQTDLAVLGALSVAPMTGYEIRAAITETLGHFWHESFGQVYPTLARLERAELVRRASPGRTSGSRFELTPAGLARLRALLAEPALPQPPRNPMLLRLFFGAHLPAGLAAVLVRQARDRASAQLARYAAVRAEPVHDDAGEVYRSITLSYGEHLAGAVVVWAEQSLSVLQSHETGRADGRGRSDPGD